MRASLNNVARKTANGTWAWRDPAQAGIDPARLGSTRPGRDPAQPGPGPSRDPARRGPGPAGTRPGQDPQNGPENYPQN